MKQKMLPKLTTFVINNRGLSPTAIIVWPLQGRDWFLGLWVVEYSPSLWLCDKIRLGVFWKHAESVASLREGLSSSEACTIQCKSEFIRYHTNEFSDQIARKL